MSHSFRNNSITVGKLRNSTVAIPGTPVERKVVHFEPGTPSVFDQSRKLGHSFFLDAVSMKSQVIPVQETSLDKISDNLGKLCQELQISDDDEPEQYVISPPNIDNVTVRSIMPIVVAKKPSRTSVHRLPKNVLTPNS